MKKKLTLSFHLDNPLDLLVYKKLKAQGKKMTDYVRYLILFDIKNKSGTEMAGTEIDLKSLLKEDLQKETLSAKGQQKPKTNGSAKQDDTVTQESGKIDEIDLDQDLLLNGLSMFDQY